VPAMKKLFGRDKPKMAKVTPAPRGEQASNSIDGVRSTPSSLMIREAHLVP
jgi:hypothetical protein